VNRAGLRRKLLKAQAEAGDIVLLFADESEALTHPYLAHAWAKRGADLRVPAPGLAAKVVMLGVLDWVRRDLLVHTSRTKHSSDVIALLEEIGRRWGLPPGGTTKPAVPVLDNGPIHTSKAARATLAERVHWPIIEWLLKYAPELNDIEPLWRDLKRHHLAHQTFTGPDDLDRAIHDAVAKLNAKRNRDPSVSQRTAAQIDPSVPSSRPSRPPKRGRPWAATRQTQSAGPSATGRWLTSASASARSPGP
jgi:transposase